MRDNEIKIFVQTADKTRKAMVTICRDLTVNDVIKIGRGRWALGFGVDYQVFNLTNKRQLLPYERLTEENVRNGDVLMLQPYPTHGGAR